VIRAIHRAASCLVAAASSGAAWSAPVYTIEEIGALADLTALAPTPPTSAALAIGDAGHVGGSSWISGGSVFINKNQQIVEPILVHGVLWLDGVLSDVGCLGGDVPPDTFPRPQSAVKTVNALGQAAGDADILADGYWHAFLYLPQPAYGFSAGMVEAPQLAVRAKAWAINDHGVIAGESRAGPSALAPLAVLWTPAGGSFTITSLASMGGASSIAYGINNLGQVTGWLQTPLPANESHAFLYLPEPAYGLPAGGTLITQGFPGSVGNDINDLGEVVGRGWGGWPMIWLPQPAWGLPAGITLFPVEDMFDQETLDAHGFVATYSAEFTAIGGGAAVGYATFVIEDGFGGYLLTPRGFVWTGGEFHLLEDILLQGASWSMILYAWDVNASGVIAGTGITAANETRGVVMTLRLPGDVDGDGAVNVVDLLALLGQWGPCPGEGVCAADFDGDGVVGIVDFLVVLGNWD
jgi:hypothetical protein